MTARPVFPSVRGRTETGRGRGQTCARSVTSAFAVFDEIQETQLNAEARRPPETIMVSWSRHVESMNSRCEVVRPEAG